MFAKKMFPYLTGLHKARFELFRSFLYLLLSSWQAVLQPQAIPCKSVSAVFWRLQGNQPGPCEPQTIKDQCSLLSTNSNPPHHIPPWRSVPLPLLTQTLLPASFFFFFFQKDLESFPYVLKCPVWGRYFQSWRSYQQSPLQQVFSS